MSFSVAYRQLVQVDVLHLFFLDQGQSAWQNMSADAKARQLDAFNLNRFLQLIPTMETIQLMAGQQMIFRRQETGVSVWAKLSPDGNDQPYIPIDDEFCLTFLLKLNDPLFYNYTDLSIADAGKLYYFSNRRPDTEDPSFPFIRKVAGNSAVTAQFQLSAAGQKHEMEQLTGAESASLLGIVRLFAKGGNSSLNLVQAQGKIGQPAPQFELQFKNRKTVWRYNFRSDQQVQGNDDVKKQSGNARILITKSEQPLTQTGFVPVNLGGKNLPNPDVRWLTPDAVSGTLYSEIYL